MKKRLVVFAVLVLMLVSLSAVPASACLGTGTPGYWKNHPDEWPLVEIWVGSGTYTVDEAIAIMQAPVKGDKCYTMFDALVAARLNMYSGNDHTCIDETWKDAKNWMYANECLQDGTRVKASSKAWQDSGEALYWILDDYNNGKLCAPSRDSLE